MPAEENFPNRPLNRPLDINSTADPKDVIDVKTYLQKAGFYKAPDYGITPYPDKDLFKAIEEFQSNHGLKVDGVMKVNGETQERMKIEGEALAPLPLQRPKIPGTNIPDYSVPEQGWGDKGPFDPLGPHYDLNANIDPHILAYPKRGIGSRMRQDIITKIPDARFPTRK